ncbi:diaminobutyrate--2-oxoglutarate transaminase [Pseudoalteromonas luteoviolacea]|uniref:diaminobutyrate--2-oxoglutarate transaminase n=1 Tax=Pseudoalteromonas luteoviolacea TaxID=43657 RepID=UPI001F2C20E3|nr:diaminobutyrate--2-oxoglutarate transaminase [Pseudoalteromonas luteoviolacea]MCF6442197.1 diaminobutyrate--2-oxoglutarate transaminase [Pseudoalteromonas luteoviolacea]
MISDSHEAVRPPIEPIERSPEGNALSFAQQRLWFIDQLQEGSPEYNMPTAFEVKGLFDINAAQRSLMTILERHEVLRTTYYELNGECFQRINSAEGFDIQVVDLTHLSEADAELSIAELIKLEENHCFDLTQDCMLRCSYVVISRDRGVLLFNIHHIASDGWSMELLVKEFTALYRANNTGKPASLASPVVQYADYAHWQRNWLQGEVLTSKLEYWKQQLAGAPTEHGLRLDHVRPPVKGYKGARVTGQLSSSISQGLQQLASAHQITPFMLIHAAFSLLLARHSNRDDIVVGTPVANRMQFEVEPLIGFFVNTLVLRVDTSPRTIKEYLSHVRKVHLGAQSHQDVPFEQLVELLNIPRNTAHTPLFQIMLNMEVADYGTAKGSEALTLPGLTLKNLSGTQVASLFDIELGVQLGHGGAQLTWIYDTELFEESHIIQLNDHMSRLLTQLSQLNEDINLSDLEVLSQQERHYLTTTLNDTVTDYPENYCVHELFEQCVVADPQAVAIMCEGETLTYGELDKQANQLARYLRANYSVGPDMLVGLCLERSFEMVVGIMAILKAGGAYVPLDPSYPDSRLTYMIQDTAMDVVLSSVSAVSRLPKADFAKILLDDTQTILSIREFTSEPLSSTETGVSPDNLAYVIYTSGSTGQPKGVMIEHKGCVNHCDAMIKTLNLSAKDIVAQTAPISFDISVWQVLTPLILNAKLCLLKDEIVKDPAELFNVISSYQISILQVVPSLLTYLIDEASKLKRDLRSIKWLLITGEAFPRFLMEKWMSIYPDIPLVNAYGPAECSDDVTLYLINNNNHSSENVSSTISKHESNVSYYSKRFPKAFKSAKGAYIYTADNEQILDFFSGAGALNYGHNDDDIKHSLLEYLNNDGVTHSLDLFTIAKSNLIDTFTANILRPRGLEYKLMFPGPTGANAVESAIKLARKVTKRKTIFYCKKSFHGMTSGALSVSSGKSYQKRLGVPVSFTKEVDFVEHSENTATAIAALIEQINSMDEAPAAIILELIQAEGGINVASTHWVTELFNLAKARGILMIVDDIQAGCGRSGKFFSHENYEVIPDIICLSKSISGYGLPMSLVLIKPEYDIWEPGEHNGTFRGNNLAFVASAVMLNKYWSNILFQEELRAKSELLHCRLVFLQNKYAALNLKIKGMGFIKGIELGKAEHVNEIIDYCFSNGLMLESAGKDDEVVKLLPPLIVSLAQIDHAIDIIDNAFNYLVTRILANQKHNDQHTKSKESSNVHLSLGTLSNNSSNATSVPIGTPVQNLDVYVLDKNHKLMPFGYTGELFVGGIGLARGYLNRPELTAEKFITVNIEGVKKRLYKTGDMVRWLTDRNLEFVSRVDDQIKIRGHRVEQGEVVNKLTEIDCVKEAFVCTIKNAFDEHSLLAFVTCIGTNNLNQNVKATEKYIRDQVRIDLPRFMMPSFIKVIDKFPTTPNGKIDKNLLIKQYQNREKTASFEMENKYQKLLCEIWCTTLSIRSGDMNLDSDFFDLGGTSLMVLRLRSTIQNRLKVNVSLKDLYEQSVFLNQSLLLEKLISLKQNLPHFSALRTSNKLFAFHEISGSTAGYLNLKKAIAPSYELITIESFWSKNQQCNSFKEAAKYYVNELKSQQPAGPYRLVGYSDGGIYAYYVAAELEAAGDTVESIVLIDANPPQFDSEIKFKDKLEQTVAAVLPYYRPSDLHQLMLKLDLEQETNFEKLLTQLRAGIELNDFEVESLRAVFSVLNFQRPVIKLNRVEKVVYFTSQDRQQETGVLGLEETLQRWCECFAMGINVIHTETPHQQLMEGRSLQTIEQFYRDSL